MARWFVRRAGGFGACAASLRRDIAAGRRECAAAYHQLHEAHLRSDADRDDHLMGFFLAMTAVNLAEASTQQDLPGNFRSHAYALLSLRIRHSLPRIFKYLSRFYMFKAKHRQRKNENIDANLKWLLSGPGQDFFGNPYWHFGQPCSSMVSDFKK